MEKKPNRKPNYERLDQIDKLLLEQGIDLNQLEEQGVSRISAWQSLIKNNEGEAEIHDLMGVELRPPLTQDPVEPFDLPKTTPTRAKPRYNAQEGFDRALIIPDMQIGYREIDGEYHPIHDVNAINVMLQLMKLIQPEKAIMNGDNLDLPEASSYKQEKGFQGTTQLALNYMFYILNQIEANSPDTETVWIEGNHEERLQRLLGKHMLQFTGITRPEEKEPVFSIQHIMRLGELAVSYYDGYPANAYWLNDRTKVEHGDTVRSSSSTASAIARKEAVNVFFGHIHRAEMHKRTVNYRGRAEEIRAQSFGTLARIDGAVPSHGSGVRADGTPVAQYEDWQQQLGLVHYHEDGRIWVEEIDIDTHNGYKARYRDHVVEPNEVVKLP